MSNEPIAIVGMACHFPGGADHYRKFWTLLENQIDAICEVPSDRWDARRYYHPNPQKPAKTYVKQGGFLQAPIDQFDPLFFGISPREAESMDPQQRFLLEFTWEAFEDAGLTLDQLKGSNTGVFVGGFCVDQQLRLSNMMNRELTDSYSSTSSMMVMLSNRLSYVFDLKGPSLTVDTACSSSLTATHLACQSIWQNESKMAVAAGVNLMTVPQYPAAMSKGHFLSKHGRCMAFDERGEGYGRGEGVGVLILKPLAQAQRDKDRIHALIAATGINQDGHTSGIAFPNSKAQQALIRQVYQEAKITPEQIAYVEAHGTGTQAGDVAEMASLNSIFPKEDEQQEKVFVGSVKTNIGHLEAGAGIAGLLKTTLCLKHQTIVPNLHFQHPNPKIPFDDMRLTVPTQMEAWPQRSGSPGMASINSFGYGGTNAHVVLQAAPECRSPKPEPCTVSPQNNRYQLLCLSANGTPALKDLIQKYIQWLSEKESTIHFKDLVYSMNIRRSHLANRLVVQASSCQEVKERLVDYQQNGWADGVVGGVVDSGKLVFVYTGMGPQWHGMGKELFAQEPVYAKTLKKCDQIFKSFSGWSLLDELNQSEEDSRMAETAVAQPANLVLQIALTELWRSLGIVPDRVVGHSVGELAAVYVSGALSLDDVLRVAYHRSRLQQTLTHLGKMLAAGLNKEQVQTYLSPINYSTERVSIAAINSPNSVTLAGPQKELEQLMVQFEDDQVFAQFLKVDIPYHSAQMDEIRDSLIDALQGLSPQATRIPWISTVTGMEQKGECLNAEYWWQNVRQPVQFAKATIHLMEEDFRHFLEVGPHPVLRTSIQECFLECNKQGYVQQSLNYKHPEHPTFLAAISSLHTQGFALQWEQLSPPEGRLIDLPHYAWQKERYWLESEASRQDRLGNPGPVWFNQDLRLPHPAWQVEFSETFFPYIQDHRVQNHVIFPGAGYVEAGLALHEKIHQHPSCFLENITFHHMLELNDQKVQNLQLHLAPDTQQFSIHSACTEDQISWKRHADGKIISQALETTEPPDVDWDLLLASCPESLDVSDQYARLQRFGLDYGPDFQTIRSLQKGEGVFLAKLEQKSGLDELTTSRGLHPTLLDAGFQAFVAIAEAVETAFVPIHIESLKVFHPIVNTCWCYGKLTDIFPSSFVGDLQLINEEGKICIELKGIKFKAMVGHGSKKDTKDFLFQVDWKESELEKEHEVSEGKTPPLLVFSDEEEWSDFRASNPTEGWIFVTSGERFLKVSEEHFQIRPEHLEDYETLLKAVPSKHILYSKKNIVQIKEACSDGVLTEIWPLHLLVQALHRHIKDPVHLTVLTHQSQNVINTETGLNLLSAPLWGFLPLIHNEYPNIQSQLIDVDQKSPLSMVLQDVFNPSEERAIAWRLGNRYVKRLIKQTIAAEPTRLVPCSTDSHRLELVIEQPGNLESLVFHEKARKAPGFEEVEIKVHASTLNFKDLMKVYGQLADHVVEGTFFGNQLGMGIVGTVVRVGPEVKQLKVGDAVMAPGPFCTYATVSTKFVLPKPENLSFADSADLIGYMTAYRSLIDIADVQPGEKVLIHNATGGVGLSAVALAQWRKAEIFATAGTEEKRDHLRGLGITHVYDSRSLSFAEQIRLDTDGYGVDVVLSAIGGEAMQQSFNLLASYGRFIEIGKKDIAENSGLLMRAFHRNLTFTALDIDRMLLEKPNLVLRLMQNVLKGLQQEDFKPIPVQVFKASQATKAFQWMARSRHIGRIVLDFTEDEVQALPLSQSKKRFDSNGSYLVTGGTSGFGLVVGEWLAREGAGQIVLISRRGAQTEDAQRVVDAMSQQCNVWVKAVDVTGRDAVTALVAEINQSDFPLKGILHGAMVLDDGFLADMTQERYRKVLAPKVDGVMNLYHATQNGPLDFFISFSSIAALIGNPGQANYVLANSFLDAFAQFCEQQGRSATSINWGVFQDVGVLKRNPKVAAYLEKAGIGGLSNTQALELLGHVIAEGPTQVGGFDVDWSVWSQTFSHLAQTGMFAEIVDRSENDGPLKRELLEQLLPLSSEERLLFIGEAIVEQLTQILKISGEQIDKRSSITNFGLDSLVAVELLTTLQNRLALELTIVDLLNGPSVNELSQMVLQQLFPSEEETKL